MSEYLLVNELHEWVQSFGKLPGKLGSAPNGYVHYFLNGSTHMIPKDAFWNKMNELMARP